MCRFDPGRGYEFHSIFKFDFFSPNSYESIGSGVFKRVKASKDGIFQINVFHSSVNYYYPSILTSARVGSMMERLFFVYNILRGNAFCVIRRLYTVDIENYYKVESIIKKIDV